ncbi:MULTISPECIES: efflux RND transporter periplasmic adaptor subunit [Desulfobacter]|uniref:efflux RND transporter periplasmic adaptor subunit n=1 Tax=Desulfobacter TaxID=2289 RepID=UPI0005548302|nr:efflux RND transporter periplasmic adaptor subunit [Desulfobacter vibrioformis]
MIRYLSLVFICLTLTTFLGCDGPDASAHAESKKPKDQFALVEAITARKQSISRQLELTGDVAAARTVVIQASVEGPLAFLPWREGDRVTKGELLVKIDRPMYQAEMQAASAAVDVARARLADLRAGARSEEKNKAAQKVREVESIAEFTRKDKNRVDRLVKTGALPEEALEKASLACIKADADLASARDTYQILKQGPTKDDIDIQKALVKEAEAKFSIARAKLSECTISAPFDGIILQVDATVGDFAQTRSLLLTIMDTSSVVVRFSVPESESNLQDRTQPVYVSFDALGGQPYPASIVRVYPQIDLKTRTRMVEVVPENVKDLVPGMFARVRIVTQKASNTVVLPEKAVLAMENGNAAAFVVKDNIAQKRKVRLGIEEDACIQILEGIQAGEQVIVAGQEKLKPGDRVKLISQQSRFPCSNGNKEVKAP